MTKERQTRATAALTTLRAESLYPEHSCAQIAALVGCSRNTVARYLRLRGVRLARAGAPRKYGEHVDNHGYVRVNVYADNPFWAMANHRPGSGHGYVLKHRLVMAQSLGRPLRSDERVHHKDGDRTNNELDNLQLRQGAHGTGIVLSCASCGSSNLIPKEI